MKYELFTRVALNTDLPQYGLRSGDIATVVGHHLGRPGHEAGYSLEVFNAVGNTMAVVTPFASLRSCRSTPTSSCMFVR